MKTLRWLAAMMCVCSLPAMPQAQTSPSGGTYTFGTVSATGQLGKYLSYSGIPAPSDTTSLQWFNDGTAASVCSFELDGSLDGIHWVNLSGTLDCTTANGISITNKPWTFVRANILTYTQGDATTAVTVMYGRGTR